MPKPMYQKIESATDLFYIGLHGPDILFYYKPLFSNKINEVGYELHNTSGKDFFTNFDYIVQKSDEGDAKALAYLYGMLCHYALDSTCHKFVGQFEAETGVSHVEIEVEFDRMLMLKDGRDPLHQSLTDHIVPSPENAECISKFYNPITPKEIEKSLHSMISYNHLLLAPKKAKRTAVYFLMAVTGNYHNMHGMIVNLQPNSQCEFSNKKLYQLYGQAEETALSLICSYPSFLYKPSFEETLMLNFAGMEKKQCKKGA